MRLIGIVIALAAVACARPPGDVSPPVIEGCADVIAASAERSADGTYRFSATVRSADTGWDKYADRWEVVGPDGTILATRVLTHPHETEQPFTRSQTGVVIPADVRSVTVRAHDSVVGTCGESVVVDL